MTKKSKMIGTRVGRLVIIEEGYRIKNNIYFKCLCDCGNYTTVQYSCLHKGTTKSCGCLRRDSARERASKNGRAVRNEKLYRTYMEMKRRCTDKYTGKENYYNKGIKICNEWLSYEKFKEDMLPSYFEGAVLDRIDNNKGYYKENCRWVTMKESNANRTVVSRVNIDGTIISVREYCKINNLSFYKVMNYLNRYNLKYVELDEVFMIKNFHNDPFFIKKEKGSVKNDKV